MNKSAIQKFAMWARTTLMEQVAQRAYQYGITKDGYGEENAITVNGMALSPQEKSQRRELVREIQAKGYDQVVEEVAYTWFNRFIALRYMEVNNYLPSHIRVFSNAQGAFDPEILKEALHIDLPGLDQSKVAEYIEKTDNEGLYRYLLLTQCNALNEGLPKMFEKMGGYTELLFPNNILRPDSVLGRMVADIPEEDWTDQVQIIGWLYQYYNAEKHDEVVNINKSAVKREDIPAATQLFTTDWVVRYMVDNSLGRYWLERNPQSKLAEKLEYLVTPKDGALPQIDQHIDPTELTFFDSCMGSGHVLIYAFDVLMEIYKECGYSERDAASAIVEHNLFGLDIDPRATQLATFAVAMKGRQYDRRFLTRHLSLQLYSPDDYEDGLEYGSLIRVDELEERPEPTQELTLFDDNYEAKLNTWNFRRLLSRKYTIVCTNPPYLNKYNAKLKDFVNGNYKDYSGDLFSVFIYRNLLFCQADGYCGFMTPFVWMFIKTYEKLRQFIIQNKSITTLIQMEYSAFEEATVPICSFVLQNKKAADLGIYFRLSDFKGGMEVQRQKVLEALADKDCGYFYEAQQENFEKIPGAPVAYWVSEAIFSDFSQYKPLSHYGEAKAGMTTGDNDRFLRLWYEVKFIDIGLGCKNAQDALHSGRKWFPYNKGGGFRKWYGLNEYVVFWENDGWEIKNATENGRKIASVRSERLYFQKSITWATLTSSTISCRVSEPGHLFDDKGSSCFVPELEYNYVLCLVNSCVGDCFLHILNPTLSFQSGNIGALPLNDRYFDSTNIKKHSDKNIELSKYDWDAYETSWDFKRHPLLNYGVSIYSGLGDGSNPPTAQFGIEKSESSFKIFEKDCPHAYTIRSAVDMWNAVCEKRFQQLKANEEELNRIFIDIYGLQDELAPEVADKDVTVHRIFNTKDDVPESMKGSNYVRTLRDEIVSLLSYAVGCLFGRYSLDVEGLAYAGGEWDASKYQTIIPDADNILPICDDDYFEDDLTGKFVDFVRVVYGEDTLEENLKFIADALGGKGTPREIIRSYFINDFFADHCKTYQKRPIYWLFDSGKKNGFKALIYLHRYQRDLLARMRTDYVHEQQERYRTQLSHLADALEHASGADKVRLTKQQKKLQDQSRELQTYEEKIHHLADQNIELDLDDGVKYNYALFGDVLAKIK